MSRQTHRKRDVWLDIDISGNGSDCELRMYGIADKTSRWSQSHRFNILRDLVAR